MVETVGAMIFASAVHPAGAESGTASGAAPDPGIARVAGPVAPTYQGLIQTPRRALW